MTINRKITVTKRFYQKALHVSSTHNSKIACSLTDAQDKELNSANPEHLRALNRIIRKTIFPKKGDKGKIHKDSMVLLYHILFGKPFDIVDMMFEEMEKNHRHKTKLIPYAPYIMLLINRAIEGKFKPGNGGNKLVDHKKYKIETKFLKQPENCRASKSKSMRVPRVCTCGGISAGRCICGRCDFCPL